MTRGCRCELSGETLVQRICSGEAAERKLLLLVIGSARTRLGSATVNRKRPKKKKKRNGPKGLETLLYVTVTIKS